jgi:hypothetical protein
VKGIVYTKVGANDITIDNLLIDGSGTGSGVTVQIFGDRDTLSNSDISNAHNGESCVIVGEYEGRDTHAVAGVVITHNRIHDCGKASNGDHDHGVYLASTRGAQVTGNTIWGSVGGWGIQVWADAHGSNISNNVLDGNAAGNLIIAGASYSSLGPSSNNIFRDNIISSPASGYNVTSSWEGEGHQQHARRELRVRRPAIRRRRWLHPDRHDHC